MSELDDAFTSAQARVKTLSSAPPPKTLLALYALFKQASNGDVSGKRPGMLDVRGRAKYDAWKGRAGMTSDDAKTAYVKLVDDLLAG